MTAATQAWSKIDRAMRSAAFRFVQTRRGVTTYRGLVCSGSIDTPLRLEISDPLFTTPPKVFIEDKVLSTRISAHLEGGSLCFAESAVEEYDLYNPGGAALRVLESVRTTLAQAYHGSSVRDQEREFVVYWKAETVISVDLPLDFTGRAVCAGWTKGGDNTVVVALADQLSRWSSAKAGDADPAFVLKLNHPLNMAIGDGPGRTVATLRAWLTRFIDDPKPLDDALSPSVVDKGILVLNAPNGMVAVRFAWPKLAKLAYAKAPDIRRAQSIARSSNTMTLKPAWADPLDLQTLTNARLAAPSPLIGRAVAVVGAGAIGSRVVLELSRCGAGQADKPLLIIDPDRFQTVNFARHVLPISANRRPKAKAMAEEVARLHPGLSVEGVQANVFEILERLTGYDLVIDATGANPVALRLNDEAVSRRRGGRPFPPILHAAIHGNGLAAQTILVTASDHACFKCLRPAHGAFKANPLKPSIEIDYTPGACGDGAYVAYAASAPMAAAGLVVQAVLGWAVNPSDPGPRVRTTRLDLEKTEPLKDKSYGVDPDCLACGIRAA